MPPGKQIPNCIKVKSRHPGYSKYLLKTCGLFTYSEFPTHKLPSCKHSKVWTCIWLQQGAGACAINLRHCGLPPCPPADEPSAAPSSTCCPSARWCLFSPVHPRQPPSSCRAAVLCFPGFGPVRLKMPLFLMFAMYYLCGKYYKPVTGQYYIADCVTGYLG